MLSDGRLFCHCVYAGAATPRSILEGWPDFAACDAERCEFRLLEFSDQEEPCGVLSSPERILPCSRMNRFADPLADHCETEIASASQILLKHSEQRHSIRHASPNANRGQRGLRLSRMPYPRFIRKFDFHEVPLKNSSSIFV